MNITAIVLDVLLVAAVLYYLVRGWRRGFLSALIHAAGYILACFGAYVGSRALAETVYQLFIRQKLVQSVNDALQATATSADVTTSLESVLASVPKMVSGFVTTFFGGMEGLQKEFGNTLSGAASTVSATIADQMLYPIIYTLLQALFFLLLFFAIMVLVRSLSRVFRGVRHIPLLGPVNAMLGGLLGLIQALIVLMIVALALNLLIGVTGDGIPYVTNEAIAHTCLFHYLYDWNPMGSLSTGLGALSLSALRLPQ